MKQSTIQKIHNFIEQIIEVLKEYLNDVDLHPTDSCLINNNKSIDVFINNITNKMGCDIYLGFSLVRLNEDNTLEPDVNTTFELSTKYIFTH